jgi:uncharacterized repeat protein (TIGR03803 family)
MGTAFRCAAVVILGCGFVLGQQYRVLYSFLGAASGDGYEPVSNLIFDHAGNLYGTTSGGGLTVGGCFYGCGTVFKLSPNSDGSWTETTIYRFCSNLVNGFCLDGEGPKAGLVFDAAGNLYGTTYVGGNCIYTGQYCGTVFELSPPKSGGSWTETVIWNFCSNEVNSQCLDGSAPYSQLVLDAAGNLYGTTSGGGTGREGGGTAFKLSPGAGAWTETVLYNFCSVGQGNVCLDGTEPMAGVTFDKNGNLYGTTEYGGKFQSDGTVYKLSPGQNGWTETVLLNTTKQSMAVAPLGAVSFDPAGNLYSTFSMGGEFGGGGVIMLGHGGRSAEFSFDGGDGDGPTAGVLVDGKRRAIFGTTSGGCCNYGSVFEIQPPAQLTVLYNFCSQPNCSDGLGALGGLVEDKFGDLFGTTKFGGAPLCYNNAGCGVVYEINP